MACMYESGPTSDLLALNLKPLLCGVLRCYCRSTPCHHQGPAPSGRGPATRGGNVSGSGIRITSGSSIRINSGSSVRDDGSGIRINSTSGSGIRTTSTGGSGIRRTGTIIRASTGSSINRPPPPPSRPCAVQPGHGGRPALHPRRPVPRPSERAAVQQHAGAHPGDAAGRLSIRRHMGGAAAAAAAAGGGWWQPTCRERPSHVRGEYGRLAAAARSASEGGISSGISL